MKQFLALAVVMVAAGCGSAVRTGAVPASQLVATGAQRTAAGREFVFTCQSALAYECRVYNPSGHLLRTKKKQLVDPQGVAAGSDGLLYVANEGEKNVLVYSAGGRKVLRALDNGGNVPLDVAVFGQTVAASNLHNVTVFLSGATEPSRTLKGINVLQGSGVGFDPNGNCFWSFTDDQGNSQVAKFAGCKGKPVAVPVTEGSPNGLAFDGDGNLWYTSISTHDPGVYRCKGTSQCSIVYNEFEDPVFINFTHDFRDLWVEDVGRSALYEVDVANGNIVQEITTALSSGNGPTGVAAAPGPL